MGDSEQQMRCPTCNYVASIDMFDCLGTDLECPELEMEADDTTVFCPKCGDNVRGELVAANQTEYLEQKTAKTHHKPQRTLF